MKRPANGPQNYRGAFSLYLYDPHQLYLFQACVTGLYKCALINYLEKLPFVLEEKIFHVLGFLDGLGSISLRSLYSLVMSTLNEYANKNYKVLKTVMLRITSIVFFSNVRLKMPSKKQTQCRLWPSCSLSTPKTCCIKYRA